MNRPNKRLIALIVAIMVVMLAFVGCGKSLPLTGTATVVVAGVETKTFTVDLKKAEFTTQNTVYDVLRILASDKTTPLTLNGTVSALGIMLTEIGELKPAGNQFITFLHSKKIDQAVDEYAKEILYNKVTLRTSGLGVSNTKLVDGIIIYFMIATF